MSYYRVLGLEREPFSTSPDPLFLYRSSSHTSALHRLEIAIRLKRGLSLLLGDVGTGKTTLARTLVQSFGNDPRYIFHIILDPFYKSRSQFVSNIYRVFGIQEVFSEEPSGIERYLFQKGVTEGRTVVLIVDEGQKLTRAGIEALRTLLNYETNEFKLLQLIIMAQLEFLDKAGRIKNFMDRIAFKYVLNTLDEKETHQMINYRLAQAGFRGNQPLFTQEAVQEIYNYSKGYPRKINLLCHQALESLIMYDKPVVDFELIRNLIKEEVGLLQAGSLLDQPPPSREITDVIG